jgi:hypothetical protein
VRNVVEYDITKLKYVTVKMLDSIGACEDQVCLFILAFGEKAEFNEENLLISAELELNFDYFIDWAFGTQCFKKFLRQTDSQFHQFGHTRPFYRHCARVTFKMSNEE